MRYSDFIDNGWHKILPKKDIYTEKDMDSVWIASFMDPTLNNGKTFDVETARGIVLFTAMYHNARCFL